MTNEEKRVHLQAAGAALYDATLNNDPSKLILKLKARDAVRTVLAGTVAEHLTGEFQDEILPLCQPFAETEFFRLAGLAGMVAGGDTALARAYDLRLPALD